MRTPLHALMQRLFLIAAQASFATALLAQCPSGSPPTVVTVTTPSNSQATTCLQTSGSVTIASGSSVTFNAGSQVYLQQGFHAAPESSFVATIGSGSGNQPAVTTSSLPSGTVGVSYSTGLSASEQGYSGSFTWSASGLPPGLSLNASAGSIVGMPSTQGTFNITVSATDANGHTSPAANFGVSVSSSGPLTIITGTNLPSVTAGSSYYLTLGASGGTPPYQWWLPSGQLPVGMTISQGGVLSGTPVVANGFSFNLGVLDSAGAAVSENFALTVSPNASTLAGATALQANLSYMPFSLYNNSNSASVNFPNSCPSGTSVEACFIQILQNLRGQGVSGVRIFMPLCSQGNSQAFPDPTGGGHYCGAPGQTWSAGAWNPSQNPGQATWIGNVANFFADVKNAGIQNVSIVLSHSVDDGGAPDSVPSSDPSVQSPTSPTIQPCFDASPQTVYFSPLVPFGMSLQSNSNAYWPIGNGNNQAYNCAPVNPHFIGTQNQFDVIQAVLAAAQQKGVNIAEFEFEQELNLTQFTAQARFLYDNSMGSGTVDIVSELRSLMSAAGFDQYRVTFSGTAVETPDYPSTGDLNNTNCADVYGDYARMIAVDAVLSGIGGWYIGAPSGFDQGSTQGDNHTLFCGGSYAGGMFTLGAYAALPDIIDLHEYPHTSDGSQAGVQQAAAVDFYDLAHTIGVFGLQAPLVMIGETYEGSPAANLCEGNADPNTNATAVVSGFNATASAFSGYSVVFRPWMELELPNGACFSFPSGQQFNVNGNGPYTPTKQ